MPTTVEHDGLRLSQSGQARQVVLLCHGAHIATAFKGKRPETKGQKWDADGYTAVPDGLKLQFYGAHGQIGFSSIAGQLFDAGADKAYKGHNIEEGEAITGRTRTRLRLCCIPVTDKTRVFNYQYSYKEHEEGLWDEHTGGKKDKDMDLLMLREGSEKHLSDVIGFIRSVRNGAGNHYQILHMAHCRSVFKSEADVNKEIEVSGIMNLRPLPTAPPA